MVKNRLVLFLVFAFFSCNSRNNKAPKNSKLTTDDSSSIFSATVTDWLNQNLRTSSTGRRIMLEERWEDDSLQTEEFSPIDSFYTNYGSVLHWSSDSSHILDIGSYGMIPVKSKKGNIELEAGEPDTEIALIEPKTNKRVRLIYVGPSSTILNARWLNNTDALVLGTFLNSNSKRDTLLWFINVEHNLFRLYNVKSN